MSLIIYYPDNTYRHFMNTEEYLVSKMVERRDAEKARKAAKIIKLQELDAYLNYLDGSAKKFGE